MAGIRSNFLVLLSISMVLLTIISWPCVALTFEIDIAPESDMAPDNSDSDIIYSPEPSSDQAFYMCASKVALDCAMELMANDFFRVHVEAKCCRQMLRMGKLCNDLLIDDMFDEIFDQQKSEISRMHNRSDHLWNKCLQVLSNY